MFFIGYIYAIISNTTHTLIHIILIEGHFLDPIKRQSSFHPWYLYKTRLSSAKSYAIS